jgi:dihydroorotase
VRLTKNVLIYKRDFQDLPKKILLKNGHLIDPANNVDRKNDILIEDGMIMAIDKIESNGFDGEVIDLEGKIVSPGWMDMHVHLREPGREDEETIESGCLAAANGGFTAVCCMPNTQPPIDSQEIIQYLKDRSNGLLVNVHPIAAITKGRKGSELAEMLELVEQGAVAISDDGDPVMSAEIMRRALEYSRMVDIPVIGHEEDKTMTQDGHMNEGLVSTRLGLRGIPSVAEEIMIARDIMLAEYTGARFHVAHISTKGAVELVRQAKAQKIDVTAEATPHHFTLNDEAVIGYDTYTKMHPPLRTEEDRQAVIKGLQDGTIDIIATDHAPHSWEEKATEFIYAPFGIIGCETALGLSFTNLVHENIFDMKSFVNKVGAMPYQILKLDPPALKKGSKANITIFDPEIEWTVDLKNFLSKSTNSPFVGIKLKGKPYAVINNNQIFVSIL